MSKGCFKLWDRLFALLLLAIFLVGCGSPESRARKLHQKGLLYAKNYQFRKAEAQFKKALKLTPNEPTTHYELARVYFTEKRYSDAEKEFREALALKPDYLDAHLGLGKTLFKGEKVQEAMEVCRAASRLKPDYGKADGLLGEIYLAEDKPDEAVAQFRLALEKQPDLVDIRIALADQLLATDKADEARQVISPILDKLDPENFGAHMLLSRIYESEKQFDKAIEEAKTALKSRKDNPLGHLSLARLYLETSRFDLALREAQQAMRSRSTEAGARFVRGCVLFQRGEYSEAVIELQSAVKGNPQWAAARYMLAQALYGSDHPEMAVSQFEELLRQRPEFNEARLKLALIALDRGWLSDAELHCNRILDAVPNDKGALDCLARTYEAQGKMEEAAVIRARFAAAAPGETKTELQLALETLLAGDPDGAIERCREALTSKPNDVGFLNVLGLAYMRKGEHEKAIGEFQRAIEADPSSISSYSNLSMLLILQKKYAEAAKQCRDALSQNPDPQRQASFRYRLGTIHRLQGQDDEALKEYKTAAELTPKDSSVHAAVVEVLLKQKKHAEALSYSRTLIEEMPAMAKAHEFAAGSLLAADQLDEAIAELQKAVEKDKSLYSARLMLVKAHLRRKDLAKAREEARELIRFTRDADAERVFMEMCPLYDRIGDFKTAAADIRALLDANKDNAAAAWALAYLYYLGDQPEQAEQRIQDQLKASAEVAPAHYILGCVRAGQGDSTQAISEFREVLRLRPFWPEARLRLSAVLRAVGRSNEAIAELEPVLERSPDHVPALLSIAALELRAGRLDAARTHAALAVNLEPTNATALRLLGDTLVGQGDLQEAAKVYARIQGADPLVASAPAFIAAAQLSSQKPDEAIATCRAAIQAGSKDARVHNVLGLALSSKGLHAEAISSLNQALVLDPGFLPARLNLARVYRVTQQPDEEAIQLKAVLDVSPKAFWVRTRLGEVLFLQKRYSEASEEFQQALKDGDNNVRIAAIAGQNYLLAEDYENARKMYELIASSSTDETLLASAYNNLAWLASIDGKDLEQALSFALKANDLQPNNGDVIDTVGWILYRLERYAQARDKLSSAVAKKPQNAVIRYHLGMAFLKDGQNEQALVELKRALSLDPAFEGSEEAKKAVADLEQEN